MLDPIYYTDRYPREGCSLTIDLTKGGYVLRAYAPNGQRLEGYGPATTPKAIGGMVEVWCRGGVPLSDGSERIVPKGLTPPPSRLPSDTPPV